MGFQHLSPEERSRNASKAAKTLWNVDGARKKELLEGSFHSREARKKSEEVRSESLIGSWARLSPENRQKRIDAAAEGVRRASKQKSDSMVKYWAEKSSEERHQHYLSSFGGEEASRKRTVVMKDIWTNYSPEDRKSRIDKSVNSLDSRRHWKETYETLSEEGKRRWVETHLRGKQHVQTEPEAFIERWLEGNRPGEWKYVGASKEVSIGGKFPDFININGKKEVIEVFGVYWHSPDEVQEKKDHYKKYGFDCKVIWEFECYDSEEIERILA